MAKRRRNIILGILAAIIFVVVILVAGGAWLIMSVLHRQDADQAQADATFEATRGQFKGAMPVFELRPDGVRLTRPIPATSSGIVLHTMHFLVWDPDQERLTQADVPLALLRWKDSPIDVLQFSPGSRGRSSRRAMSIRLSELERYGPALLVDQELEEGRPILIWTE